MKDSEYVFPAPAGTSIGRGVRYSYLIDKGGDTLNRIVPPVCDYWKYHVKIATKVSAAEPKILTAQVGEIVLNPHFSGKSINPKDRSQQVLLNTSVNMTDSDIIKYLVDARNEVIKSSGINYSKAPMSFPNPNSPEGKLYEHSVKISTVDSLKNDLDDIKNSLEYVGPRSFSNRLNYQYKNNYHSFPGGRITSEGVEETDNENKVVVKKTKATLHTFYNNIDHRKASWARIKARGEMFNPLFKAAPSTLLQPIKQWVKAIGDVENLAISALLSIYSIITLADFDIKEQPKDEDNNNANRST
jgi:hypothetical protein